MILPPFSFSGCGARRESNIREQSIPACTKKFNKRAVRNRFPPDSTAPETERRQRNNDSNIFYGGGVSSPIQWLVTTDGAVVGDGATIDDSKNFYTNIFYFKSRIDIMKTIRVRLVSCLWALFLEQRLGK